MKDYHLAALVIPLLLVLFLLGLLLSAGLMPGPAPAEAQVGPTDTPTATATVTPTTTPIATPTPDFSLTKAKVSIVQETQTQCPDPQFGSQVSCVSDVPSDTFDHAQLQADHRFPDDLMTDIVAFEVVQDTCADLLQGQPIAQGVTGNGFSEDFPGLDVNGPHPGNQVLASGVYSFEGNAMVRQLFPLTMARALAFAGNYSALSMQLKVTGSGKNKTGALRLHGNAPLCEVTGPVALLISMGGGPIDTDKIADSDIACIDLPTVTVSQLDVSEIACGFLRF